MKTRWIAAAVAALSVFSASAALAQDKMGGTMDKKMPAKSGMMGKKSMMKGTMYCCKECKMCYSAADAKKMGMKDPMGHKLAMMKKMPAGYTMGHAGGKMGGKMMGHDKMDHGKMGGGKM